MATEGGYLGFFHIALHHRVIKPAPVKLPNNNNNNYSDCIGLKGRYGHIGGGLGNFYSVTKIHRVDAPNQ